MEDYRSFEVIRKYPITIQHFSKILTEVLGEEIGQKKLFQCLRDNGYLNKEKGTQYNWPTPKSTNNNYIKKIHKEAMTIYGVKKEYYVSLITPKGQEYFINLFKKGEIDYENISKHNKQISK